MNNRGVVRLLEFGGAGGTFFSNTPLAAQEGVTAAGAASITTYYTAWTTTGADALTLANGAQKGQLKKIKLVVDGGSDGTLTPTTLTGGTTITFADAGDYVILAWDASSWVPIELGNDVAEAVGPILA